MEAISRRRFVVALLCGVAVATVGSGFMPNAARAIPLADFKPEAPNHNGLVEQARVTVHVHTGHRHRHRGRHWRCWWHRGRRVCGWR